MTAPVTISFTKTATGFTASPECKKTIMESLQNCNESNFELITPKKARSNKQNAFYHGVVLRLLGEYVDKFSNMVTVLDSGKLNTKALHRHLTFQYCLENNRPDMCEFYETVHNGQKITVPIASWSFEKMSAKDAKAYLDWLEMKFKATVGCSFDEMLKHEQMEVG